MKPRGEFGGVAPKYSGPIEPLLEEDERLNTPPPESSLAELQPDDELGVEYIDGGGLMPIDDVFVSGAVAARPPSAEAACLA